MNHASDKPFEQRARALYHEAAHRLDPATAGRLRAARRTALEAVRTPAPHHRMRALLPAGALAAVALAALMVWQPLQHDAMPAAAVTSATHATDNELPPDPDGNDDPGLYQNLDFYSWLASTRTPSARTR
jgi:hypothetical protein